MALGEIDNIVNNLVNRGLVSPKMVGRTVGQATIESLKSLGSNLSQLSANRSTEQASRLSDIQSRVLNDRTKNLSILQQPKVNNSSISSLNNPSFASGNPFAVGSTGATGHAGENQVAVAIPTSSGYMLQSHPGMSDFAQQAIRNAPQGIDLPTLDTVYAGSGNRVQSLQDLQNFLMKGNKNTTQISGFFNK